MKRKSSFFPGVGASSILMIFVVLCLTTFGVLSYVTANADGKISTKNAESVENYYKAYAQTQSRLAAMDGDLLKAGNDAEKAVASPLFLTAMDDSVYNHSKQFDTIIDYLKSDAAKQEKLAYCYREFSSLQLARADGVTVARNGDGEVQASFSEPVDANRKIEVTLTVNPYGSAKRYQITEQKLIGTQVVEDDGGETLSLWQGSSAQ